MKVLYHSTSYENLDSILSEGLTRLTEKHTSEFPIRPGIFLAGNPFWAAMYGGDVVLRVTIRDKSLLYKPRWGMEHEYVYRGPISPGDIEVLGPTEDFLW